MHNDKHLLRMYVHIVARYHGTTWTRDEFEKLEAFTQLWEEGAGATGYLFLSAIAEPKKYKIIKKALEQGGLTNVLSPLVELLVAQNRLELMPAIVHLLAHDIKKHLKIEDITIYSAHALSSDDIAALEQWVAEQRHAALVRSRIRIMPELLAGFRIEGTDFMCDYSVQLQLQRLQHMCRKEGYTS